MRIGWHFAFAGNSSPGSHASATAVASRIRVDREEKQLILDSNPDVYFTSPHYDGYPGVQIRVEAIDREELFARLEDAWLIQAPKKLAAAYVADTD